MRVFLFLLCSSLVFATFGNSAEPPLLDELHTWKSTDGRSLTGKFSRIESNHVVVSTEIKIPVERLDPSSKKLASELSGLAREIASHLSNVESELAKAKIRITELEKKLEPASASSGSTKSNQSAPSTTSGKLTAATYAACKPGMTYENVVQLVGTPDSELSQAEFGGIRTVIYVWKGGIIANANMTFQNGKLVGKAQFGL